MHGDPSTESGDPWARVDELKRIANRYLDEHRHDPPKIRSLPLARYELIRSRTWMAQPNQTKCGSRARIESNMYGNAVGDGGIDVLSCARLNGHSGRHTSAPIVWAIFGFGWKVGSWETPDAPEDETIGSDSQHTG